MNYLALKKFYLELIDFFLRSCRTNFFLAFDLLATFMVSKRRICESAVLLVRLDNIGDFILWLDAAKEYRNLYPNQKIILVANVVWADLANHFNYWDEVWAVHPLRLTRNLSYRWQILRRVRKACFEIAINPTFSRAILFGDSLIRASAATHRIGSTSDLENILPRDRIRSNFWYTQLVPATHEPLMELERNLEFSKGLGVVNSSAHVASIPKLNVDISHLELPENYFIISPGASVFKRKWPVERFAEMAKKFHKKTDWLMVICGSKHETYLSSRLSQLAGINTLDLSGVISLPEFVEVVRGSQILIGNDSSAVHISAAVQVQSVCILGGGHFGRFIPYPESVTGIKPHPIYAAMDCYGCSWKCVKEHNLESCWPCIGAITTESLNELANQIISSC